MEQPFQLDELGRLERLRPYGRRPAQRSEGGGLGIGSSQGMGSFMGGRGTANLLTRGTAILGTAFFVLALSLALLNRGSSMQNRSILDSPAPASAPAAPAVPSLPAVPNN